MTRRWQAMVLATLAVFTLVACTPARAPAAGGAGSAGAAGPRLQAILLQMAAAEPTRPVAVIVQKEGKTDQPERMVARLGGMVTSRWTVINGFAAELPAGRLPRLAAVPGVRWVSYDAPVQVQAKTEVLDTQNVASAYPFAARADKLWSSGIYGNGVTVAVIDSGVVDQSIRNGNYDLYGRVVAGAKFADTIHMADRYGHGTHVAGIVAGDGATLAGKYMGIAPRANIINLKMSNDMGAATERGMLDALDWVVKNQKTYKIRIVNISSTSGTAQSYTTSPLCAAVEYLWQKGIVVVVSAGNRGSAADAVYYPPANDPYVITVGAIWDKGTQELNDDEMATWSSRGVTQNKIRKPDVLAPGSRITSMSAGSSTVLASSYPQNLVDGHYLTLGGTSMAAPVVSGVVALMLQVDPALTPDKVKWILMNTGRKWGGQQNGDPDIVAADAAAWYSKSNTPGLANRNLTPSPASLTGDSSTNFNTVYWLTSHEL